ncbi:hypothetical protein [Sphingobacterium sp. BIGb0165]|uniref:hypothetical protein n=1 Tax=Sphingobacterium sp. BIGb0165 TaxID=2940615 RepID=UPI0021687260|nr:hypothetical protein [Sphingobacterium sp. BIGb0165]MCS4226502.1 hypothetical protein [Sphingobacterium sp. BIGb0165]
MKEKKTLMLHVARQVLMGKLTIEEAMEQSQVKDRRTIVSWAKRAIKADNIEKEQNKDIKLKNTSEEDVRPSVEEKIIRLESELANFKNRNMELLRFQNVLTNKINDLEILINYAERTYKIDIMRIKRKKNN